MRGAGSTFVEMIHRLLSSWLCMLLIWLPWSHFPKLANSSRQTHSDRDLKIFFRKCLTPALHVTNYQVGQWCQHSLNVSVCFAHWAENWEIYFHIFIIKKNPNNPTINLQYEGLYGKVMHIWSYTTVPEKENKEWLNGIEVVIGYLQRNCKNHILNKEWQTDIYCHALQSCLVWWQGTLACNILFTVHYMT